MTSQLGLFASMLDRLLLGISRQQEALNQVAVFAQRTAASPWRLQRSDVAQRLRDLIVVPDRVKQGHTPLCGGAIFLRAWLQNDPTAVARFAAELFETGASRIGANYVVAPDSDSVIAQNYYGMRSNWLTEHPPDTFCPSADWMILGSIRDQENLFLDFEGRPGDSASGITVPSEIIKWLQAAGLYRTIQDETNLLTTKGLSHLRGLVPDPQTDVYLLIDDRMLAKYPVPTGSVLSPWPTHWVNLTGSVAESGTDLVLPLWTWGQTETFVRDRRTVASCYYGAIVAKW